MPAPPSGRPDRYDPLPGLLQIPGFLFRKLGPRGRVAAVVLCGLVLAGAVVAAIVLVPQIGQTKRERAAEEKRELAAAQQRERRRLIAEQRPRYGVGRGGAATSPAERSALVRQVETSVVRDQRARVRRGLLAPPPARYATCEPFDGEPPGAPVSRLSCTAVTSEVRGDGGAAGLVGHPYFARVDYGTGRYAWCKVSGRAGEGSFRRLTGVKVPRACGGG